MATVPGRPAICPGCGRCNTCGTGGPAPLPAPLYPFIPPYVLPPPGHGPAGNPYQQGGMTSQPLRQYTIWNCS